MVPVLLETLISAPEEQTRGEASASSVLAPAQPLTGEREAASAPASDYASNLLSEMAENLGVPLRQAASAWGDTSRIETWRAFCQGNGLAEATAVLEQLTAIAQEYPTWKRKAAMKREVDALTRKLDEAALAWYGRRR
jgi:hypothetical protein